MPDVPYVTPQDVEAAFYEAFARRDLDTMLALWAEDDAVVCVHPGGERLEGRAAVDRAWRQLFANDEPMRFEIADARYVQGPVMAVHSLRELIHVDGQLRGVMLATNVYQQVDGAWRMLMHHASPDPEARRSAARRAPPSQPLH